MSHYWPGSIFHLSVCWLAQRQACSSPEPGERWCRGYTRSLPSPPQKLCDTSPPASSLCSPASKHKTSSSYLFTVYLDCCWHLCYLLLNWFFYLCHYLSSQNLVSMFHHHVDEFTEKQRQKSSPDMNIPMHTSFLLLWAEMWVYLMTGSSKTELETPLVAALMGLRALSSRCSFSSALSSVSGRL